MTSKSKECQTVKCFKFDKLTIMLKLKLAFLFTLKNKSEMGLKDFSDYFLMVH